MDLWRRRERRQRQEQEVSMETSMTGQPPGRRSEGTEAGTFMLLGGPRLRDAQGAL